MGTCCETSVLAKLHKSQTETVGMAMGECPAKAIFLGLPVGASCFSCSVTD